MDSKTVVGIHNGHNASAAVVCDGELRFALQEERLTRIKNQGGLPKETLTAITSQFPATTDPGRALPVAFGGENLTKCEWQREAILASYGNTSQSTVGTLKGLARKSPFVSRSINHFKMKHLEHEISDTLHGPEPR